MTSDEIIGSEYFGSLLSESGFVINRISLPHMHKLTHQTIIATFVEIKISVFLPTIKTNNILLAFENELGTFPVPKLIDNYLTNNNRKWQA